MFNIVSSSNHMGNTIRKAYRLKLRMNIAESTNLFNRKHLVYIAGYRNV